jgi:acyl-ACP thioesterase
MKELEKSWKDQYLIHSYEVDRHSSLSIVSAINFFQESAWLNAESMGFGFKALSEKNRFWVLSRLYVEMYRYPVWGDVIQLETWPKGMERLFAMRDFRFKAGDELLGAGTSAWLIIDGTSHKLQRVEHVLDEMPCYPHDALDWKLGKIELPDTMISHANIIAGYMDVDVNNHVNNVCYLNWAVSYLPLGDRKLTIRSVEINFLSEALLHSPVEILYGDVGNELVVCSLRHPDTGKEYCRFRIQL